MTNIEKRHISSAHEHHDEEKLAEAAEAGRKNIESRLDAAEKAHNDRQSEREAVEKAALLAREADKKRDEEKRTQAKTERHQGAPSKKQLRESFSAEMKGVQAEMGTSSRLFSKLLHNPAVEKTTDVIGSTLARPNAMLSGSIAAFISITVLYFIAQHYGYRLSGFETIGAFIAGWIAGILYDYFSTLFRGQK